jgi:hypothetical protein
MKLWKFGYDGDNGPRTEWCATKYAALASMREREANGEQPYDLVQRELPKTRGHMAAWLNHNNVESWQ